MCRPYDLHEFCKATLCLLLQTPPHADSRAIESKLHISYLDEYFSELGAKIILVENHYVDKGFLEDYVAYYARCFEGYQKNCRRLHFFSCEFTSDDFDELLVAPPHGSLASLIQRSYLGFIVVKPLPQTVIGRTCLRIYPHGLKRFFPVTREYEANLFGLKLRVESLPYQEQDATVAACATSALWSAFQATAFRFQHRIISPVEITMVATDRVPQETRALPNAGLNAPQIAEAIRSVDLEPQLLDGMNELVLKSALYAYLRDGIPVLMGIELIDVANDKSIGRHAITVAGYHLGKRRPVPYPDVNTLLEASRIDKIYAHDDQIGPFARMAFIDPPRSGRPELSTSWPNDDGDKDSVVAEPLYVFIPLYHKIRIPFEMVQKAILIFDLYLEWARVQGGIDILERVRWDLFLTDLNSFRRSLLHSSHFDDADIQQEVLCRPMPRFIWRAVALVGKKPVVELLFDATDIEQGKVFIGSVDYCRDLTRSLHFIASELLRVMVEDEQTRLARAVLRWFRDRTL